MIWVFAVVVEIDTKGIVSYQVFKIDWTQVKRNIEAGIKTAVTQLVSELPASPESSRSSTREPILPSSIRSELDSPDSSRSSTSSTSSTSGTSSKRE
jgi:hypothetical protein